MAADILGIGESRVKFNPSRIKEADKALTRYDVRNLIKAGVVTKLPVQGRKKNPKKQKQGQGSRKGALKARRGDKDLWMAKVRAQRALLTRLLEEGVLDPQLKRKLYGRIKSGLFRSKRALILYLKDGGMLDKGYELISKPKPTKVEAKPKEEKKETKKEAEKQ
jgi:large subunit ribosomal protein L19e